MRQREVVRRVSGIFIVGIDRPRGEQPKHEKGEGRYEVKVCVGRTGCAVLLALIHILLVLASRGRLDTLPFDKVKLRACPRSLDLETIGEQTGPCVRRKSHHFPPAGRRRTQCTVRIYIVKIGQEIGIIVIDIDSLE